ncbi:uncharacterized protein MELLADRAFT_66400 [Melampsora larici-populina 98AG31]|uniref:Uncharacterized protein n=1 Tax=Melampsora larici-populina (strain 98AG31 / pathotype 3-4-7) TaxID=747676 RepID=F4RZ17_MELLP|nr:uncharacterized protein MELLADRAFT_66400 [Melampsora larici-populina 98AG31]EGG02402.1 hypothetical protein MELLADRAFT_66400 [Melampsora larici-populina 98AG31]
MIRFASTGGEAFPLQFQSLSEQPVDLSQAFGIGDMEIEEEDISCFHDSTLPTPKQKLQMSHSATSSEDFPSQSQSWSQQLEVDLSEAFEIEDTEVEEEIACYNSGFMIPSSLNLKGLISGLKISQFIRSRPLHRRIIELRTGISLNPPPRKKQKIELKEINHNENGRQTRLSPLSQTYSHYDDNIPNDSKIEETETEVECDQTEEKLKSS